MNRYFISDPHHNHARMLETRTQFHSVEEMNETMIENINKRVKDRDLLYILGDISMKDPYEFLDRLNGRFIILYGNHDKYISHPRALEIYKGFKDIKIEDQKVTLCHFPMHSWNCSHWGAWHLYGHHHYKSDFGGKTMNVTMDALDFNPVSWEEIKEYMKSRPDNWDLIKNDKK